MTNLIAIFDIYNEVRSFDRMSQKTLDLFSTYNPQTYKEVLDTVNLTKTFFTDISSKEDIYELTNGKQSFSINALHEHIVNQTPKKLINDIISIKSLCITMIDKNNFDKVKEVAAYWDNIGVTLNQLI